MLLILLCVGTNLYAQDTEFKRTSIRTGIGLGANEGLEEIGFGLVYSIGWQKSYGKKNKLRLNPNLLLGGFSAIGITDVPDQHFRITSLGLNIHYDLIKYKSVSIVTTVGGFVNYSRGLIGTGGWPSSNPRQSDYFFKIYYGVSASVALRVSPKNSRFAYEWRHISLQGGNDNFLLAYIMFGIDFKLKK